LNEVLGSAANVSTLPPEDPGSDCEPAVKEATDQREYHLGEDQHSQKRESPRGHQDPRSIVSNGSHQVGVYTNDAEYSHLTREGDSDGDIRSQCHRTEHDKSDEKLTVRGAHVGNEEAAQQHIHHRLDTNSQKEKRERTGLNERSQHAEVEGSKGDEQHQRRDS
jgi:hypothetical protein